MGFINEKVTEQERNAFKQKKIQNPLSPVLPVLSPVYWTIDREKDTYLFKIGTHRDFPDEEYFYFKCMEYELIIFIGYRYESPNICKWNFDINKNCKYNKMEISKFTTYMLELLKDALVTFQLNGKTEYENQEMNVICEF